MSPAPSVSHCFNCCRSLCGLQNIHTDVSLSTLSRTRVPAHPRNGFERPKLPKIEFLSNFYRRIWMIFSRFSIDLSSMLARFSSDFRVVFSASSLRVRRPRSTDKTKETKSAQVSRPSCVLLLELARTTSAIHPTTCEPTLYTFEQAVPT